MTFKVRHKFIFADLEVGNVVIGLAFADTVPADV
jgi:hypothetical protein